MIHTLSITQLGNQGDGLATWEGQQVSVPFTLIGDVVSTEITRNKEYLNGKLIEVITPSTNRVIPPCPVFGSCGGCRLQHMKEDAYRNWKLDAVNHLLQKNNFDIKASDVFITPSASRRRVSFTARKENNLVQIGFYARETHSLISTQSCAVLKPELDALIEPLQKLLNDVLENGKTIIIHVTVLNGAIEILFSGASFSPKQTDIIASWGAAHKLARIYTKADENAECSIALEQLSLIARYGDYTVTLPPHAFMQASDEAETAMIDYIKPYLQKSKNMADLFCGTGLFALHAYDKSKTVLAVDVDGAAINALHNSTQNLRGFKTHRRNLFREPLKAIEVKNMDTVILDPPRAGAKEQTAEIARSKIIHVLYVSCNPQTFMRDARLLVNGGYALKDIKVFDQFLWSHHIELIGIFSR